MKRQIVYSLLGLLAVAMPAPAATPRERFGEAQALFETARQNLQKNNGDPVEVRQQFYASADRFAALAADGVRSANLCVNAGNAYHFAGDNPRALLWYLRAAQLANAPQVRNGVAALRRACQAELWPAERGSIGRALLFWHYELSRTSKQRILLAVYPLGGLSLLVSFCVSRRRAWRRAGLTLLFIGAVMGISDVVAATRPPPPWAVVISDTKGYAGDGETYSVLMERIAAGQEAKILEVRRDWIQVQFPAGAACWLPARTVEAV